MDYTLTKSLSFELIENLGPCKGGFREFIKFILKRVPVAWDEYIPEEHIKAALKDNDGWKDYAIDEHLIVPSHTNVIQNKVYLDTKSHDHLIINGDDEEGITVFNLNQKEIVHYTLDELEELSDFPEAFFDNDNAICIELINDALDMALTWSPYFMSDVVKQQFQRKRRKKY